jgi:hypothetical protein
MNKTRIKCNSLHRLFNLCNPHSLFNLRNRHRLLNNLSLLLLKPVLLWLVNKLNDHLVEPVLWVLNGF